MTELVSFFLPQFFFLRFKMNIDITVSWWLLVVTVLTDISGLENDSDQYHCFHCYFGSCFIYLPVAVFHISELKQSGYIRGELILNFCLVKSVLCLPWLKYFILRYICNKSCNNSCKALFCREVFCKLARPQSDFHLALNLLFV